MQASVFKTKPGRLFSLAFLGLSLTWTAFLPSFCSALELNHISLPPGFNIELYASVPNARSMALGEQGTLFVGNRSGDSVYAVRDEDGDNKGESVTPIASGLHMPNGVVYKDGDLYVAEVSKIHRFANIEDNLDAPQSEVVFDGYPDAEGHGWKYIAFGPDGMLYVPVGAPCNVCEAEDPFSSITRLDLEKGRFDIFARGIRNTVGFDWHPATGELWFTNNGRDWMGDNKPPDSLHKAPEKGLNFGFPYCHAGLPDPELRSGKNCDEYAPAQLHLPAHVAALGMKFYTGQMFPEEYRGAIFIAEHGSWNRSSPVGYRVTMARFQENGSLSYTEFATGWLQGEKAWGRPVDVLVMPDGALLVSDDRAGAIYRISYKK